MSSNGTLSKLMRIEVVARRAAEAWVKHACAVPVPSQVQDMIEARLTSSSDRREALYQARMLLASLRHAGLETWTVVEPTKKAHQDAGERAWLETHLNHHRVKYKLEHPQQHQEQKDRALAHARRSFDRKASTQELIDEAYGRLRAQQIREGKLPDDYPDIEAEDLDQFTDRSAPVPGPQIYGVSNDGAERLCATWMRCLGVADAEVTRISSDGGIDVGSSKYVAQVKNYTGSVGVPDIRALYGVAAADSKNALLFTSGSVTAEGRAFAERTRLALLRYDAVRGTLVGLNTIGILCVEHGIPDAFWRHIR